MPWEPNAKDLTPAMSSNTTPSPYVITYSTQRTGINCRAYGAFSNSLASVGAWGDNGENKSWVASDAGASSWIQFYMGSQVTAETYDLTAPPYTDYYHYMPRTWELYGSNNGVDYTLIDEVVSGDGVTWTVGEKQSFEIASPGSYSYYKFLFYKYDSHAVWVGEIELMPGVVTTAQEDSYNSILTLYAPPITEESYNALITLWSPPLTEDSFNAIIALWSPTFQEDSYNSIIGLKSAVLQEDCFNAIVNLAGGLYITIPIQWSMLNVLYIGCESNIFNFTKTDELPFSDAGGRVS